VGHQKAVAAVIAVLLGFGCASIRWTAQKSFREPGETLRTFPERVWDEYDCDSQKRPFFVIEENELVPPRVRTGGEFNHRLVYAMCPIRSTEVISGRLFTRIRFKGDPIVRETVERYEIKPGRWVVDAFVTLPDDAEAGVYAFELQFESPGLAFEKSLTFAVRNR
jgi:hypothetical protein